MTYNKTDDAVVYGVMEVLNQDGNEWSGTMTDLNSRLSEVLDDEYAEMLPRSPSALRVVLNRVINRLRCRSIKMSFNRTSDRTRTRYVELIGK